MTGLLLTSSDFKFDTYADFADKTVWEEGIKDGQIFPLQGIYEFDDNTSEVKYYESPLGDKLKLDDGKYGFTFRFDLNLEIHKELQNLSGGNLRYFRIDSNNNVLGFSDDGTTVKGYSIKTIEVEKMVAATADTPAWSPVTIVEANPAQLNKFGLFVNPDWVATELIGAVPVTMTGVGTPSTTEIVVAVGNVYGLNSDGSVASVPMAGIDPTDIVVTKAGVTEATSFVDNGDGTYTGTGTYSSADELSVCLKAMADMATTGLIIACASPVVITIP